MILKSLAARDFRNLVDARLEPGPRVTVLSGENGAGKTNLLEAAYFIVNFRSFRARALAELPRFGAGEARIAADVGLPPLERRLEARIAASGKTVLCDGKPVRRDADALAGLATVLFSPEDLLLPRDSPAARRRFLDRALFALDRHYGAVAASYDRILRSRNRVLREGPADEKLLASYDEELARAGAQVIARRRALVAALAARVPRLYRDIHADLSPALTYRADPGLPAGSDLVGIASALLVLLRASRARDLRRGATTVGPHTDDLDLVLAGRPATEHGSQGQLRSLVLALKLAELDEIAATRGQPPMLLLDDVSSELDQLRRERLFAAVAALSGQTLITVTDADLLPVFPGRKDLRIAAGKIFTL